MELSPFEWRKIWEVSVPCIYVGIKNHTERLPPKPNKIIYKIGDRVVVSEDVK